MPHDVINASCEVYVDDVRVPSGLPGDDLAGPVVLSGLTVNWGRETTLDQPEGGSCSFDVANALKRDDFIPTTAPRESFVRYPRAQAGNALVPQRWLWQNGTSETTTETLVANAADGPAGNQVSQYYRRTITKIKTGGNSGHYYRATANPDTSGGTGLPEVTFTPGESWTGGMFVRSSAAITVHMTMNTRTGAAHNDDKSIGPDVTLVPNEWTWITGVATAGAVADGAQIWVQYDVSVPPVGATIDATGALIEKLGTPSVGYFDGDLLDTRDTSYSWTLNHSVATPTGVPWLAVGSRVDVFTDAVQYWSADASSAEDPSFEQDSDLRYRMPTNQQGEWTTDAHTGAKAIRFYSTGSSTWTRQITPAWAYVSGVGLSEYAWRMLPRSTPNDGPWTIGAWIKAAPGTTFRLAPVTYSRPSREGTLGTWRSSGWDGEATGEWQYVSSTVTLTDTEKANKYVGLALRVYNGTDSGGGVWGETIVDDIMITPPPQSVRRLRVFSGRVTALTQSFDESIGAAVTQVQCIDFMSDLENTDVGDVPWPVEPWKDRWAKIVAASGVTWLTTDFPSAQTDGAATWKLASRDVDRQPMMTLLHDIATSIDLVAWPVVDDAGARHIVLEDQHNRESSPTRGLAFDSCRAVREPVTWVQDVQDVATRVLVKVKGEPVEEGAERPEYSAIVTNDAAEAIVGQQRIAIDAALYSAQVIARPTRELLAQRVLDRTSFLDWRVRSLTVDAAVINEDDTTPDEFSFVFITLLSTTGRVGAPLSMTHLPQWAPIGADAMLVFCEGGRYTHEDGMWSLELTVSQGPTATTPPATIENEDATSEGEES